MHQLGTLIKHELTDNLTSGRYILNKHRVYHLMCYFYRFNVARLPVPRKTGDFSGRH